MKMCLVMILVKKVFIFSKTMIICLLCPLLCGLFFFWKGAKGELSYKARKITSKDVDHIYKKKLEDKDNRIFLFVRKNKNDKEKKKFYFLGEIYAEGYPNPIHMESTNDDAFEILYRLDTPVRSDIYDYIVRD